MDLATGADASASIDGLSPRAVAHARSVDEIVDAIRSANEAKEAVVLRGGGTRLSIGDAPERYDVCLDLSGLSGVVRYEPEDFVITIRAGTTLAELADVLSPHRQRWPIEAGAHERATIGGTLASAAGGASRLRYFHPRDWVLGLEAVLGDGTRTRAGGRVVKNVTGYDLTKLYAGTFGTLCCITEVTLKLAAIPERTLTLRADAIDLGHAYKATRALLVSGLPLDALAVLSGPIAERFAAPTWNAVWVRLAGSHSVVERLRAEVDAHLPFVEDRDDVWPRLAGLPLEQDTSLRLSWPAGAIEPYPGAAGGLLYPGLETLHAFSTDGAYEVLRLREILESLGGAVVVERAPTALRRETGTWGTPRTPPAIARALKQRFDPNDVLAPGRMAF